MDSGSPLNYARVSTDGEDLTARTDGLIAPGVAIDQMFAQEGMATIR
jgi:hypothetical protein